MSDDYTGHLLEQILDEVKAVHELVAGQPTRTEFNELREDVSELKRDVHVLKAAMHGVEDRSAKLALKYVDENEAAASRGMSLPHHF